MDVILSSIHQRIISALHQTSLTDDVDSDEIRAKLPSIWAFNMFCETYLIPSEKNLVERFMQELQSDKPLSETDIAIGTELVKDLLEVYRILNNKEN